MQGFVCHALCLALAGGTAGNPARAGSFFTAPTQVAPAPEPEPRPPTSRRADGLPETIEQAEEAWRQGNYAEVRRLLEPFVETGADSQIDDPLLHQKILVFLADATLADKTLDFAQREALARGYLDSLMMAEPDWELPRDIYPELYELYKEVRAARAQAALQQCQADLTVCRVDSRERIEALETELSDLKGKYADQTVVVQSKEYRSRVLAAIPGGFGHFYTGHRGLGAAFLSAELAFGAAALGLYLHRTVTLGCRRTRGFQEGSLSCDPKEKGRYDEAHLVGVRKAEEVMLYFLIGTVIADIVWSQVNFEPVRIRDVREVPRRELQNELSEDERRRPRRKPRRKQRAKVRPSPAMIPGGAGLGLELRF